MAMWAKPGAKCVCIDDARTNRRWRGTTCVVKGCVYTVRGVLITPNGRCVLTFEEVLNPLVMVIGGDLYEWGFGAHRFRPVQDVPEHEDVALFQHHLTSTNIEEMA
jgi:hypothetical protein